MTTTYQLPMFARLEQRTPWNGGILAGSDVVTLDDAAKFASKHAGTAITPADFLRAAGRGQIPMLAICPCAVTMEPCRDSDKPLTMPESSIPTLPLDACKALSNTGRAKWRTIDGFEKVEAFGGVLGRFTRWQLPDTEPDILTTADDCRVMGWDVHSLADAFIDKPAPAEETKEQHSHIDDGLEYSGLTDSERKERARAINRATQAQWDRIKNDLADRHYQHTENIHNEWQAKLAPAQPPRVEPHTAPAQTATTAPVVADDVDFTMLATRTQLIDVFGKFTGMDKSWFDNLTDTPKLMAARKFKGQSGRKNAEPLFCPYEVMQWLADPKQKKCTPLSEATAWRLLKNQFPKVYNRYSIVDPNAD